PEGDLGADARGKNDDPLRICVAAYETALRSHQLIWLECQRAPELVDQEEAARSVQGNVHFERGCLTPPQVLGPTCLRVLSWRRGTNAELGIEKEQLHAPVEGIR